jgi:hypothetical protein
VNASREGHKYYSGRFLITALRHQITQDEYTIHVEAIKDGYRSTISSGFEVTTPIGQFGNLNSLTEEQSENLASMGGQNSTLGGGLGGGNDSFR